MPVRQRICGGGSVALSAAVVLVCAAAASAQGHHFEINPVIYSEFIARYAADTIVLHGPSNLLAEKIALEEHPYTTPVVGHEYTVDLVAETQDEGPVASAYAQIQAADPGDQSPHGAGSVRGEIHSYCEYYFVVYNTFGTETEFEVPLIVKGNLFASARIIEHGENPYTQPVVRTAASVTLKMPGVPGSEQTEWALADGPNEFDVQDFTMSRLVLVGKASGDHAWMELEQSAYVLAQASTNVQHWDPEQRSYNTVLGQAVADPVIYIDPTWEHADKFGLAFPDNVTFIPEPSTLALQSMSGLVLLALARRRRRWRRV